MAKEKVTGEARVREKGTGKGIRPVRVTEGEGQFRNESTKGREVTRCSQHRDLCVVKVKVIGGGEGRSEKEGRGVGIGKVARRLWSK